MKTCKTLSVRVGCVLYALAIVAFATVAVAHQENLHMEITRRAFLSSIQATQFLSDYFQTNGNNFVSNPLLQAGPHPLESMVPSWSPREWLVQGSYYEDGTYYGSGFLRNQWRCLDHFYCPLPTPRGLSDNSDSPWIAGKPLPSGIVHSFAWASTKNIPGVSTVGVNVGPNTETWPNAREYQFLALTHASKNIREYNLALMFYALGHVLHLNQDTSSPDHARNDSHKKKAYFEDYGGANYRTKLNEWFVMPPLDRRGWSYWQQNGFTKLEAFWNRHLYGGQADKLNQDAASSPNAKLGLAEFSNGNFLGEDAVYGEYFPVGHKDRAKHYFPYPSIETSTDFSSYTTIFGPNVVTTYLKDQTSIQRFPVNKVRDGIPVTRHSMFNYLGAMFPRRGKPIQRVSTTINDPTVLDNYHKILIPKAIEYSAGIIDYFFRGQIDAELCGLVSSGTKYQIKITNRSGQDFKGGEFTVFREYANGDRAQITPLESTWTGLSTLANNAELTIRFSPPVPALGPNEKLIVVYQGTIGINGNTAIDPVDAQMAIAARTIPIGKPVWWNLDNANPNGNVDIVHGVPLNVQTFDGATVGSVAGRVGGAMRLSGTPAISGGDVQLRAESEKLSYRGNGFSVVLWYNPRVVQYLPWLDLTFDLSPAYLDMGIGNFWNYFSFGNHASFYLNYDLGPGWVDEAIVIPGLLWNVEDWNMLFFGYDPVTEGFYASINNGTLHGSAPVGPFPLTTCDSIPNMFLRMWLERRECYIDELGVFPTFLNSAQRTYIYNGGAGRTWPMELP